MSENTDFSECGNLTNWKFGSENIMQSKLNKGSLWINSQWSDLIKFLKNTQNAHISLYIFKTHKVKVLVAQWCPALCNARGWLTRSLCPFPPPGQSSPPRDRTVLQADSLPSEPPEKPILHKAELRLSAVWGRRTCGYENISLAWHRADFSYLLIE